MCIKKAKKESVRNQISRCKDDQTTQSRSPSRDGTMSTSHDSPAANVKTAVTITQDNPLSRIPAKSAKSRTLKSMHQTAEAAATTELKSKKDAELSKRKSKSKSKSGKIGGKADSKGAMKQRQQMQSTRVSEIEDQLPSGTSNYSIADSKMKQAKTQITEGVDYSLIKSQRTQKTMEVKESRVERTQFSDRSK